MFNPETGERSEGTPLKGGDAFSKKELKKGEQKKVYKDKVVW